MFRVEPPGTRRRARMARGATLTTMAKAAQPRLMPAIALHTTAHGALRRVTIDVRTNAIPCEEVEWYRREHFRGCRWVVLRSTRKRRSEDAIVGG